MSGAVGIHRQVLLSLAIDLTLVYVGFGMRGSTEKFVTRGMLALHDRREQAFNRCVPFFSASPHSFFSRPSQPSNF